jgi:transposase
MYYAGLDVHSQYVTIAVVDKSGALVRETEVPTREPEVLRAVLTRFRPLEVVVEASGFWPWVYDLLVPSGITFHLAHARKLRAIAENAQKNDQVDARLLARMLLSGLIPPAYPKVAAQLERVRLVRHRATLVRERSRMANRIHGQLRQRNIVLLREKLLRQDTRRWLHSDAWSQLTPEQQAILTTHFAIIDELTELLRPVDRRIRQLVESDPAAELLQTIPGIGVYWAALVTAEVLPIERFRRPAHLVSYAGLAPRTRSSGGHTRHGPVPAGCNRWLRWAFVSAIPSHVRHAPESQLTAAYIELKARLGWRVARVAAARKLARMIYQILRTNEPWCAELTSTPTVRDELQQIAVAPTT